MRATLDRAAGMPRDLAFGWGQLRGMPQYQRAPRRTLGRLATWGVHCALQRPALVRLPRWGARISLPAGLKRGATAVYLFRDQYEPELDYLDRLLRPGDVFIDAGACMGIYTVAGAKLVGTHGRVLSFEPASATFSYLQRNVEINHLGNVTTVRAALSDRTGSSTLYHAGGAPHYSLGTVDPVGATSERVETTTLDEVVAQEGLDRLSCIKIDVEGAEELLLRGAKTVLAKHRPTVIFEVNPEATARLGLCPDGAIELLAEQGYRFELIRPQGAVPMPDGPYRGNVVAVPA